jgi:hypothetical protein
MAIFNKKIKILKGQSLEIEMGHWSFGLEKAQGIVRGAALYCIPTENFSSSKSANSRSIFVYLLSFDLRD